MNELVQFINDKAKEFGADLVGVASVKDLKRSPLFFPVLSGIS